MALQNTLYEYLGIGEGKGTSGKFFKNDRVFSDTYIPEKIIGRDKEKNLLSSYFQNIENTNKHTFIFGKKGTGKTVVVKHVMSNLKGNILFKNDEKIIYEKKGKKGAVVYVSGKKYSTKYEVINRIAQVLSESGKQSRNWSSAVERIETFTRLMDFFVVILDEIDYVDDKNNDLIYLFSRWGELSGNTVVSLILISNKINFLQTLEERALSSYQCLQIPFYPYDAMEIRSILEDRANIGLQENALDDDVIPYISAIVAGESGDAREAIHILKVATEIAGLKDAEKVTRTHVDLGKSYGDLSALFGETITSLPFHEKFTLKSIAMLSLEKGVDTITTGDIYKKYKEIIGENALSQRRIRDYISELNTLDLIEAKEISRGRYGRTRVVTLKYPANLILEILKD